MPSPQPGCSKLRKDECQSTTGCNWIVGKGCSRTNATSTKVPTTNTKATTKKPTKQTTKTSKASKQATFTSYTHRAKPPKITKKPNANAKAQTRVSPEATKYVTTKLLETKDIGVVYMTYRPRRFEKELAIEEHFTDNGNVYKARTFILPELYREVGSIKFSAVTLDIWYYSKPDAKRSSGTISLSISLTDTEPVVQVDELTGYGWPLPSRDKFAELVENALALPLAALNIHNSGRRDLVNVKLLKGEALSKRPIFQITNLEKMDLKTTRKEAMQQYNDAAEW